MDMNAIGSHSRHNAGNFVSVQSRSGAHSMSDVPKTSIWRTGKGGVVERSRLWRLKHNMIYV